MKATKVYKIYRHGFDPDSWRFFISEGWLIELDGRKSFVVYNYDSQLDATEDVRNWYDTKEKAAERHYKDIEDWRTAQRGKLEALTGDTAEPITVAGSPPEPAP